ncbi:hypothetical protein NEMBOFW57_009498 [Staphylotrichum longicolle]|uniref:Protein kinase domain-containing protein n=1 Tax=Staphylotrichum longicolle TaxID=669026 RepID=A0AAD4HXT7_9PEZI|nr:hypothetical protein NEMBOFW57_009498 [Staphylotrichum longicolle]
MPRLVLECAPFGSLEDQHDEDPISVEEAFEVLCQGLSALRYLHEREDPIVHRDIKPSNILVQSRFPTLHIKLSDFGLSRASPSYLKTYCGTPLYTAPEVFARENYDAGVDVWSLGMVAFQYAKGRGILPAGWDSEVTLESTCSNTQFARLCLQAFPCSSRRHLPCGVPDRVPLEWAFGDNTRIHNPPRVASAIRIHGLGWYDDQWEKLILQPRWRAAEHLMRRSQDECDNDDDASLLVRCLTAAVAVEHVDLRMDTGARIEDSV